MRNPERIKPFLYNLQKVWAECPDLRFGQLIKNIESHVPGKAGLFYIEDEDFEKAIERFEKKLLMRVTQGGTEIS